MKTVQPHKPSALVQLARWFHQDFFLQFHDVRAGGAAYISQLSDSQCRALLQELDAFLAGADVASEKALRRAWLKLGAQTWPKRGDTRAELIVFSALLRKRSRRLSE